MTQDDLKMHRRLYGAVKMLASDADHQSQFLAKATEQAGYAVLADDITTEFGCWHRHSNQLAKVGMLSTASLDHLNTLSALIGEIAPEAKYWTTEALTTSTIWDDVRGQARVALASMNEK